MTKTKNVIIFVLSMLLAISMASLTVFVFMPMYHSPSQTQLEFINNTGLLKSNQEIYLSEEADITMSSLYKSLDTEIAGCLFGTVDDKKGIINITEFKETTIVNRSNQEITFIKCPSDTLITVHSHPNGVCSLSDQDKTMFNHSDISIQGVICGEHRYGFFNEIYPTSYIYYQIEGR